MGDKKITILITGFEDDPAFDKNNISARTMESIIKRLPFAAPDVNVAVRVFPIDLIHAREAVKDALDSLKPDFVICLGQDGQRNPVPQIEYVSGAVNRVALNKEDECESQIEPDRPADFRRKGCLSMDLMAPPQPFRADSKGQVSVASDGGNFLCNTIYYEMLRQKTERGEKGNVVFLHLAKPNDYMFRGMRKEADPLPYAEYYAAQIEQITGRAAELVHEQARTDLLARRKEGLCQEVQRILDDPGHKDHPLFSLNVHRNPEKGALQYLLYRMGMLPPKEKPGRKLINGHLDPHTSEALTHLYAAAVVQAPQHWSTDQALEVAIQYEDRLKSAMQQYQKPKEPSGMDETPAPPVTPGASPPREELRR